MLVVTDDGLALLLRKAGRTAPMRTVGLPPGAGRHRGRYAQCSVHGDPTASRRVQVVSLPGQIGLSAMEGVDDRQHAHSTVAYPLAAHRVSVHGGFGFEAGGVGAPDIEKCVRGR